MEAEPLEPRRVRYPKGAYGWIDLRIVTGGHLEALGPDAALVYLFLCTVGNRSGISFWSRARIAKMLNLTSVKVDGALATLIAADLIAANDRVVQVLPVPDGCRQHLGAQDAALQSVEGRLATRTQSPDPTQTQPIPNLVEPDVSDADIRAYEAQARGRIARFYGSREPSAGVVRALARSLALRHAPRQPS